MQKPITQSFWDNLSEKAQWDIKVALRGPDSYYGETLKWFTTSVIRGKCHKIFRVGGTVNTNLDLVILPSDYYPTPSKEKSSWNSSHFVEHIEEAAAHLQTPVVWIDAQLWHKHMQGPKRKEAIRAFLTYMGAEEFDSKLITELQEHYNHLKGEL